MGAFQETLTLLKIILQLIMEDLLAHSLLQTHHMSSHPFLPEIMPLLDLGGPKEMTVASPSHLCQNVKRSTATNVLSLLPFFLGNNGKQPLKSLPFHSRLCMQLLCLRSASLD